MRLTEAGQRLYDGARPALGELRAVEEEVKELGDEPSGTLRLHVSSGAERVLRGPLLGDFLTANPRVRLELIVTEHTGEIVEAGYAAAVGLLERIEQDMIAIPVSEDLRLTVVGAPSYFAQHPAPQHPRDLANHVCLNWTPGPGSPPYRWEFTEDGRDFALNPGAAVGALGRDELRPVAVLDGGGVRVHPAAVFRGARWPSCTATRSAGSWPPRCWGACRGSSSTRGSGVSCACPPGSSWPSWWAPPPPWWRAG